MRMSGSQEWKKLARAVHSEATAAGYSKDAAIAQELLNGRLLPTEALMFL
jgi:spore germination cell wall hydrolase CwlJ-like protein